MKIKTVYILALATEEKRKRIENCSRQRCVRRALYKFEILKCWLIFLSTFPDIYYSLFMELNPVKHSKIFCVCVFFFLKWCFSRYKL